MIEQVKPQNVKILFTVDNVAERRNISSASARVYCSRKVKRGDFIRLKNNLYILKTDWDKQIWTEQLKIANRIQVPSYISLFTALAFYELTTQVPMGRIESVAQTRTYSKIIEEAEFTYTTVAPRLYFGFTKKDGLFIAEPEKALADCVYLCSFGKYALDFTALDLTKINKNKFDSFLNKYPDNTQKWWGKNGDI